MGFIVTFKIGVFFKYIRLLTKAEHILDYFTKFTKLKRIETVIKLVSRTGYMLIAL